MVEGAEGAAIVTGGQRGIGLAIAEAFARAGHPVVVADIADGDRSASGEALAERWGVDVPVLARRCDVADAAAVARWTTWRGPSSRSPDGRSGSSAGRR